MEQEIKPVETKSTELMLPEHKRPEDLAWERVNAQANKEKSEPASKENEKVESKDKEEPPKAKDLGKQEEVEEESEKSESDEITENDIEEDSKEESEEEPSDETFELSLQKPHTWTTKSGKTHKASLQELRNAYSLYEENKKRLSEIDLSRKDLDNRTRELDIKMKEAVKVERYVEDIKKLKGEDLLQRVFEEVYRINPKIEEAFSDYYSRVFGEAQQVLQMTPEQRAIHEERKKVKYYEEKEKKQHKELAKKEQEKLVNDRLSAIYKTWEVDESVVDNAYELALRDRLISEKTSVPEALDTIEQIIKEYKYDDRARVALEKLELELDDKAIGNLIDWQYRNPEAGQQEIESFAKKLFGKTEKPAKPKANKSINKNKQADVPREMIILRGNQLPPESIL